MKRIKYELKMFWRDFKDTSLPDVVLKKYKGTYYLGIALIILSIIMVFVFGIGEKNIFAGIFPLVLAFIFMFMEAASKVSLVRTGCDEIKGVCAEYRHGISVSIKKKPTSFILETENEYIIVPVMKRGSVPPIDAAVTLYIPSGSFSYKDNEGYRHYFKILTYSV